jgi:hypothetical protein
MPKDKVDYSNTTIYKIYCNDESITDLYVGHTTNFIVRKYQHKTACNNHNINRKIYKTIRENGGWDNWNMVEIAKYNCKDSTEARIKEQEHYDLLKPSLNCCLPYNDKINNFCSTCNLKFAYTEEYNNHINSEIHKNIVLDTTKQNEIISSMIPEETKKLEKTLSKYYCEHCDFKCSQKCDWDRHNIRPKHISNKNKKGSENKQIKKSFTCNCGKDFKNSSGLWKHNKKCKIQQNDIIETTLLNKITDKDLIIMLIKQNECLTEQNNQLIYMLKSKQHVL